MANVFIEQQEDGWVALQNKRPICYAGTQTETGQLAHDMRPFDTIFGERVRNTDAGTPDKWRVLHHPQER